jgi:16S rRNA (uracil1498-N3)-methyltransferase
VLRLGAGDSFVAFDPRTAQEATGTLGPGARTVTLGSLRDGVARAATELVWIQGLAKGDKCDAVVRDATELGATRVVVASTHRSVVKLDPGRGADRQARWDRIAREAARQCGRSDPPRVDPPTGWAEALASVGDGLTRFVLWERATDPLGPRLLEALAGGGGIAFACGPEGGLDEAEVQGAVESGWSVASLGRFTLRTETVASAVLGAVRVWGERRG